MRSIRFVVLTMLAIVLTFSLQTSTHAADTSTYKLAYLSYNDNEIWTINPDGSDAWQITNDGVDKVDLVASPDGHYLAYYVQIRYDSTTYIAHQVAVVLNVATGEQEMITGQEAIIGLKWSPDSQRLLFAVITRLSESHHYDLYVINRDGSGRTKIADRVSINLGFSWSPDGKHILLSPQNEDGSYQILIMNADGSNPHETIRFSSCFICDTPRWIPDGESILFYKHPDLFIVDGDGQNLRQLTDFAQVYNVIDVAHARYGPPSYSISTDGQNLYYTMGYPLQIVKLDLTGNGWANRTILYDDQTRLIGGNQLSPDGKLLFFGADSSEGHLLSSLDLATHQVHILAKNVSQAVFITSN